MAEIVNLRAARKARARAAADAKAAVNRVAFGRTKGEKARDAAETARGEGVLDGAKRQGDGLSRTLSDTTRAGEAKPNS
jgi:hypothetical protein